MNLFDLCVYKNLNKESGGDVDVSSLVATENKTYNAGEGKAYNPVIVEVPEPTLISKSITANGNYSASADNADGYSSVSVNVPLPSNAYLLQTIEHKSIATFTNGTDNFLKSLEVAIEPIQSGSGDPSPTNIRPIIGWDEVNVTRCGKNLFDKTTIIANKIIDDKTGEEISSYNRFSSDYIKVNSSTDYYASNVIKSAQWYCVFYYDKNKNYLSCGELSSTGDTASGVVTTPSNCGYVRIVGLTTYVDSVSFVVGNRTSTYEEYTANAYTIDLDGTRYGGTLDVVNGVLTLTDGFIPSYNGETLPSTWISDRDVYVEGTTPTIGAEVCYKLATPQTIQLTPTIIKSLQGDNNVFASTGEIEMLQYWSKEA